MPRVAQFEPRFEQRQVHLAPLGQRRPVDGDRPTFAVVWRVAVVKVILEPVHSWQQFLARPSLATLLGPAVVVFEHGAMSNHVIDGATATKPLTPVVASRVLYPRSARQQFRPLVLRVKHRVVDTEWIGAVHLDWRFLRAVIWPSFEQKDRRARILAQPRGKHGSRGTGADDDVVIHTILVHARYPSIHADGKRVTWCIDFFS